MIKETKEFLKERQKAYRAIFDGCDPKAREILFADLEPFCRANETTFHPDDRFHAALEGRREVYLRIKDHLDLSLEQLCEKYARKKNA